jgi:hypothetical protein
MFSGSRSTLLLFLWVFYVGVGLLSIYEFFLHVASGDPFPLTALVDIPIMLFTFGFGLWLALNVDRVLPAQRRFVISTFWTLLAIESVYTLGMFFLSPQDPTMQTGDDTFVIATGVFVGLAFSFLVTKIVVDSVNVVSRVPVRPPSAGLTALYWFIVLAFFASALAYIFWDPATGTYNVL